MLERDGQIDLRIGWYEVSIGFKNNVRTKIIFPCKNQDVQLNELELALASNLVNPVSIRVGFDDVGGLDDVINDLGESVILPLKNESLFKSSKLLQPPKGVLLYGPPGCGKTMIAKATAREAGEVELG